MLSAEEKVRRVLSELEALLLAKAKTGERCACDACGRAERYARPSFDPIVTERLARARAYAEMAVDNADRALEQIELAQHPN